MTTTFRSSLRPTRYSPSSPTTNSPSPPSFNATTSNNVPWKRRGSIGKLTEASNSGASSSTSPTNAMRPSAVPTSTP